MDPNLSQKSLHYRRLGIFPVSVETLRLVIYKCEVGYTWKLDIGYFDVPSQLYI